VKFKQFKQFDRLKFQEFSNTSGYLIQFFLFTFSGLMRKTLFWVLFKTLKVCNKEQTYLNNFFFCVIPYDSL